MSNQYQIHIRYEDTDHSGFAYHVNYLKFFERARQNLIGLKEMQDLQRNNVNFTIANININYIRGAVFGNKLTVESDFKFDGDYKLIFDQKMFFADSNKIASKATTTLACINTDLKLIKIPDELKRILREKDNISNLN